jgi:dTDP-L-rhamnose 4-epimerase
MWLSHPRVVFERGDIRDLPLMERLLAAVDSVVHLAAETGTGQSMYQVARYYDVNAQATAALLESIATRHKQIRRTILASSRAVYGEGAYLRNGEIHVPAPRSLEQLRRHQWEIVDVDGRKLERIATPESAPAKPASVYAATKLANEQLAAILSDAYGCSITALRFQNVYGERQSLRNPYTGLLSILSNRMRQNLAISVFEDGLESRDFVHVSDVVGAIELSLMRDLSGFEIVNVGSGVATSVSAVVEQLRSLLRSDSVVSVTGEFRAGDIRHCYADLRKAEKLLGFVPTVDLENGLRMFADWAQEQPLITDKSADAANELSVRGLSAANPVADVHVSPT